MRNYQRKKNNPYRLPHALYMIMLYLVRDYERLNEKRKEKPDAALVQILCEAVEQALHSVPEEYRKGVWNNICYRVPYPIDAGLETYGRWRRRFLYAVAENLSLI